MKKYETGIFIGKFYPFHNGHLKTLDKLLECCSKVFLVFYYVKSSEKKISDIIHYDIDLRIEDTKKILEGRNVEIYKFIPDDNLIFPDHYSLIKKALFEELGVKNIDVQIFGQDEENIYKDFIYADRYICGDNIYENSLPLHANNIRNDYDKYKKYLNPIIRVRFDKLFNKQKIICITGKSGTGKSTVSKYLHERLENSIYIDIDYLVHESHKDNIVKNKIIDIVGNNILDDNNDIDRKKLGEVVFNDIKTKERIYDITWDYVDNIIKSNYKSNYNYIILDWYNIIYKKYWDLSTIKILMDRPYEERKKEVISRDKITEEYFDLREKNSNNYDQIDYDYKINLNNEREISNIIKILKN